MTTASKTIFTVAATTILGAFTFFLTIEKKGLRKTLERLVPKRRKEEKDELFI